MTRFAPLLLAVPLGACVVPIPIPVPNGTPGAIVVDPGDPCGARGLRDYVGQDRFAVEGLRVVLPGEVEVPVRIVAPGQGVSADYVESRVNFNVDAGGRIASVTCG